MTQNRGIGQVVHYMLSEQDAAAVNDRREDAEVNRVQAAKDALGYVLHVGNAVAEGDVFPMMIVKVWGREPTSSVNGQVFLDGGDVLWVTSVSEGEGARHFTWP